MPTDIIHVPLGQGGVEIVVQDGAPNTGNGVRSSLGSLLVDRAAGVLYVKSGAGVLNWSQVAMSAGFLPLAGGTLTGPLVGTSATFIGTVTAATFTGSVTITAPSALFGPGGGSSFILARNAANTTYVDLLYMDATDTARIPRALTLGGALTGTSAAFSGTINATSATESDIMLTKSGANARSTYLYQQGTAFGLYDSVLGTLWNFSFGASLAASMMLVNTGAFNVNALTATTGTFSGALSLPAGVYHTLAGNKFAVGVAGSRNILYSGGSIGLQIINSTDTAVLATFDNGGSLSLTGSLTVTGQGTFNAGIVAVGQNMAAGSSAAWFMYHRDDATKTSGLYATGGLLRLWTAAMGDVLTADYFSGAVTIPVSLTVSGNVAAVTANIVKTGASGAALQVSHATSYGHVRISSLGANTDTYLTLNPNGAGRTGVIQVNDTDAVLLTPTALTMKGSITALGDIFALRQGASLGTGVIYFNAAASRYLYWSGSVYNFPGAPLDVPVGTSAFENVFASGFMNAAASSGYQLGGVAVLKRSATYTVLGDASGVDSLVLGNGTDPTSYYSNTAHAFRNKAGTVTYLTMNATVAAHTTNVSAPDFVLS